MPVDIVARKGAGRKKNRGSNSDNFKRFLMQSVHTSSHQGPIPRQQIYRGVKMITQCHLILNLRIRGIYLHLFMPSWYTDTFKLVFKYFLLTFLLKKCKSIVNRSLYVKNTINIDYMPRTIYIKISYHIFSPPTSISISNKTFNQKLQF